MAKTYDVRRAFQSPGLKAWICRDTVHLVPKLPDKELKHALDTGAIIESTGVTLGEQSGMPSAEDLADAPATTSKRGGR